MRPIITLPTIRQLSKIKPSDGTYGLYQSFLGSAPAFVRGWESAFSSYVSYLLSMDDSIQDSTDGSYIYTMDSAIISNAANYIAMFLSKQATFLNLTQQVIDNLPTVPISAGTDWDRLSAALRRYATGVTQPGATSVYGIAGLNTHATLLMADGGGLEMGSASGIALLRTTIEDFLDGISSYNPDNERASVYTGGDMVTTTNANAEAWIAGALANKALLARVDVKSNGTPSYTQAMAEIVGRDFGDSPVGTLGYTQAMELLIDVIYSVDKLLLEAYDSTLTYIDEGTVTSTVPAYLGPPLAQTYIILKSIQDDLSLEIPFTSDELTALGNAASPYILS